VSQPIERGGAVGDCPGCGERIPVAALLVEYDRGDGTVGRFAECPGCQDVVEPA